MRLLNVAQKQEGVQFDPTSDYTFCRICGTVFQTDLCRYNGPYPYQNLYGPLDVKLQAQEIRRAWSFRHEATHTSREHVLLAMSGRFLTPEAANKLAAYGVIDLVGLAIDEEVADAYRESSPVIEDDAETIDLGKRR